MDLLGRISSAYIELVRRPFEDVCKRTAKCLWNSEAAGFLLYAAVFSSLVASSACIVLCGVEGVLFLLIAGIPPLAARLYRHTSFDSHRRGLRSEEPYFLVYASAMHAAGIPLYTALEDLDASTLPAHGREAERYRRISRIIQDPYESLARLADTSISRSFSRFLRSYIGALRSGSGLDAFFEVRVEEAIRKVRDAWMGFADLASEAGEALSLVNVLGVFMVLLYGAISGYTIQMILASTILMPLISGLVYLYIGHESPGIGEGIEAPLWLKTSYLIALASGLAAYVITGNIWIAVVASSIPLLASGLVFEKKVLAPTRRMEALLPTVIKEISDYSRLGYPLSKSLSRVADEEDDPGVRSTLYLLRNIIDSGERLPRNMLRKMEGHARYVYSMVHGLSRTMLAPPRALEALASFMGEAVYSRMKVVRRMRMHEVILYVFAPITLYSLKILADASSRLAAGFAAPTLIHGAEIGVNPGAALVVLIPALLSHGAVVEKILAGTGWQALRRGLSLLILGLTGLVLLG